MAGGVVLAVLAVPASPAAGPNPDGLAVDNKRGRLYVTSIDAYGLEAFDLATLAPIATVAVGAGPWGGHRRRRAGGGD